MVEPTLLRSIWPQSEILLNDTLAVQGVENPGDDGRIACVRQQLSSQKRVSVVAVGGSITAGSSYTAMTGGATFLYHHKFVKALDTRYPVTGGHGHHNGGVPGTGPTYMEHCVHDHLPPDVDLVLLEYAVNIDRRPEAFERLLRRLLLHPRMPALVVVNAHRWRTIRCAHTVDLAVLLQSDPGDRILSHASTSRTRRTSSRLLLAPLPPPPPGRAPTQVSPLPQAPRRPHRQVLAQEVAG